MKLRNVLIISLCAIMTGAVSVRADNDGIEAAKARCVKVTLKDQGLVWWTRIRERTGTAPVPAQCRTCLGGQC